MSQDLMQANGYLVTKRAIDSVGAGLLLLLLLPVLGVVALLVRVRLGGPVLFSQRRPGKDEKEFTLYKFRSMVQPDPTNGLISDQDRITPFGQMLRSTSLDELPSLWNILKGEMSFVGPRPLLVSHLPRYSPEQGKRHLIRPGLTGLAQVSGRNLLPWDERLGLDVEYVERVSWKLDLWILVQTFAVVLNRTGISQSKEEITMEEFFGPLSFSTLALRPTEGLRVPRGIEMMPGCSCGHEFHDRGGSATVEYQNWVTLRDHTPLLYDWVAVDPANSTAKAVCGLTLVNAHNFHRGVAQGTDLVAELYVAVLRPEHAITETDAAQEVTTIGFQAISLVTTRALALGVKELRVTCAKTNDLMLTPLLQFGFEIIRSVLQSNNYLLSFETNLGQSD
ncbi:sugar transferase [Jonesiaceae bacterium BS-20]|uniref:Sugar transferase n=1 Tax=Jonesiaceae bacterium BS-20 TaxID=3120821 RepID=A0AAU7DXF0_9MICO